jgi:hypothetical protein
MERVTHAIDRISVVLHRHQLDRHHIVVDVLVTAVVQQGDVQPLRENPVITSSLPRGWNQLTRANTHSSVSTIPRNSLQIAFILIRHTKTQTSNNRFAYDSVWFYSRAQTLKFCANVIPPTECTIIWCRNKQNYSIYNASAYR